MINNLLKIRLYKGGKNLKYIWLDEYCLSKKGVEKDFKLEWNATRYTLRGKIFALQGRDKEGKSIITVKLEPIFGELLRSQYKDIVEGYYMNKEHWNSLYLDGNVPDNLLRDMIDKSYGLLLVSLNKKAQKEILEG